jgi:hypothetical protein
MLPRRETDQKTENARLTLNAGVRENFVAKSEIIPFHDSSTNRFSS